MSLICKVYHLKCILDPGHKTAACLYSSRYLAMPTDDNASKFG